MPITVRWYDQEKYIAIAEMSDPWTMQELSQQLDVLDQMQTTISKRIILISDLSNAHQVPKLDLAASKEVSGHKAVNVKNLEINYIIGMGPRIRIMIDLLKSLFPSRFKALKMVNTMEEALESIHKSQSALAAR